jgi:hypothetical protein
MKQEFMRIGGARTEKEFYEMYPTEQDFIKKHGGAINKLMARGGEAYPQTATMDNFFTYGVPVPPTYYAHGGAFPMAQPEDQFFSPFYGNVPNPYNKAMGGSSEAYPQSMSFPYGNTGRSTHFMMEEGGYMPEEQTLPKMGVNGKLLEFVGTVKNTAANKLNSNLRNYGKVKNPEQYEFEQAKWGGNLKSYQSEDTPGGINDVNLGGKKGPIFEKMDLPKLDVNSDKGTTNNYYYGPGPQGPQNPYSNQMFPPEYYNDIDYMYSRRRPISDFNIRGRGMAGNYRATGWLKDEYGLDRLREMGLTRMDQSNPKWYQFLKRPTQTYYFGNQGQGPMGYVPGQVDQQGMPVTNQQGPAASATPGANGTGVTADKQTPANQADAGKDMGFFGRLFHKEGNIVPQAGTSTSVVPDQQVKGPDMINQRTKQMWNPEFTDWRNQHVQNRLGRMGDKIADLEAHREWQRKQLDDPNMELSGWRGRQLTRLSQRRGNLENKMKPRPGSTETQEFGGEQKKYQSDKTTGTVKTPGGREVPLNDHKFNENTTFKPSMTVEEYLRSKEMSEGLKQQIKDSNNPDIQWTPVQGVVDRQQIGNQPVGGTTIIPFVVPSSPSNSKPSFYAPGADMFDGVEYITPDSINFDSTNTQHRAAMMRAILDGATDDAYDDLMPGMKNKKYGGSYNTGDVVDMTPEELQRFIAMGGQVEFLD